MSRARYEIVEVAGDYIMIKDVGHGSGMSVTNDAERVVDDLAQRLGSRKLLYIDSDGKTDELIVRDGRFAGFAPGPGRTP